MEKFKIYCQLISTIIIIFAASAYTDEACFGDNCRARNDRSISCECADGDQICRQRCEYSCRNGGTVRFRMGSITCICAPGYYGEFCEEYNPCVKVQCANEGLCVNITNNEYKCQCADGFYGETCRQFNPCSSQPCLNDGQCRNLTETLYSCTCYYGHYGVNCEHFDPCFSSPCANGGECTNLSDTEYTCACPDGYLGSNCEQYQPCIYDPCLYGGLCNSIDGHFYCDCPRGRFGRKCENLNLCDQLQPCGEHSVACHNMSSSSYRCLCELGWAGVNCTEYSPCLKRPCMNNGECDEKEDNTYVCKCDTIHYGSHCERTNLCAADPCEHNAVCKNTSNTDYTCTCTTGYFGRNCQFINPCFLSVCQNGATCRNTSTTTYDCICDAQHFGDKCQFFNSCADNPCKFGLCRAYRNGTYSCDCNPGYFGHNCEHYQACSSNPCRHSGTCLDTSSGEYRCRCEDGYYGTNCEHTESCLDNPCGDHGSCLNLPGGDFKCSCIPGRYGRLCDSTNPCSSHPCEHGDCFQRGSGTYECHCETGYYGLNCQMYDPCASEPCQNNGHCVRNTRINAGSFRCDCQSNYQGLYCEQEIPCNVSTTQCNNHGYCKTARNGTQFCQCWKGFSGSNCQLEDPCLLIDECQNGGMCKLNDDGTGRCDCVDGYFGEACELHRSCKSLTCKNNGMCVRGRLEEKCHCPIGYKGHRCEEEVNACLSDPCIEGQKCLTVPGEYRCTCPPGYNGESCEDAEMCDTQTTHESRGTYTWNKAPHSIVMSIECTRSPGKYASRRCLLTSEGRAEWQDPDTSQCQLKVNNNTEAMIALQPFKRAQIFNWTHEMQEALELLNAVLELATAPAHPYTPTNASAPSAPHVAGAMMAVINSMLEAPRDVLAQSGVAKSGRPRKHPRDVCTQCGLLEILDEFMSSVKWSPASNDLTIAMPNFEIYMKKINWRDHENGITYTPSNGESHIYLPPEVFLRDPSNERVKFIYFKNAKLFSTGEGKPVPGTVQEVLSATVGKSQMRNFRSCVSFSLSNKGYPRSAQCVYWDEKGEFWATDGLHKLSFTGFTSTCCSTHLTYFAVASNPDPSKLSEREEQMYVNIISSSGAFCGIITSVVVLFVYVLCRSLNIENLGKIIIQLSLTLILMNISLLLSQDRHSIENSRLCTFLGMAVHFTVLSVLAWILLLVQCVFVMLGDVPAYELVPRKRRIFTFKRSILGFGVPLFCVGLTGGLKTEAYLNDLDLCRISQYNKTWYYSAYLLPSCFFIMLSIIISVFIIYRYLTRKDLKKRERSASVDEKELVKHQQSFSAFQVFGSIILMACAMFSWLFDVLAMHTKTTNRSFLFSLIHFIMNGLCGLSLIVFFLFLRKTTCSSFLLHKLTNTGHIRERQTSIKRSTSIRASSIRDREGRYSLIGDPSISQTDTSNATPVIQELQRSFHGNSCPHKQPSNRGLSDECTVPYVHDRVNRTSSNSYRGYRSSRKS